MKKIIAVCSALILSFQVFASPEPNEKVLQAFHKTFDKVQDVSWTEYNERFEACFKQNDIPVRVVYDAEGNVLQSIRYYKGNQLPILIQGKLGKKYEKLSVFGVTELSTPAAVTYHIVLEDAGKFYHVESDGYGNMNLVKTFHKS